MQRGNELVDLQRLLLNLQFNVSSIGFAYWITAISRYSKNYYKYNNSIEAIYEEVAQIHNTTRNRVERCMRTARRKADYEIQKQFNYYNKITNKTVLELLTRNRRIIETPKFNYFPITITKEELEHHFPRID